MKMRTWVTLRRNRRELRCTKRLPFVTKVPLRVPVCPHLFPDHRCCVCPAVAAWAASHPMVNPPLVTVRVYAHEVSQKFRAKQPRTDFATTVRLRALVCSSLVIAHHPSIRFRRCTGARR